MAIKTFAAIDVGSFELELEYTRFPVSTASGKLITCAMSWLWEKIPTMTERSHMCWWTKCARSSGSLWRL